MPVHCKKIAERMGLISAFRSKKQDLFITYITHFRTFQSLQIQIFQYKSLHCCNTLLKINKYKSLYLENHTR
jgi:hypothetical protein